MHIINIFYKVAEAEAEAVEKTREAHANFMKETYVTESDA